jgi:hypothetical protein
LIRYYLADKVGGDFDASLSESRAELCLGRITQLAIQGCNASPELLWRFLWLSQSSQSLKF